jgi:VIT1/CCC1 family predicted Fe2+/Mn2+ transporter
MASATVAPRVSFGARHLDPATRMGELLFGLIMTLTFTLGAGLVIDEEGREGVRAMLIAILGCNLAWGVIDGVLYVMSELFERGRLRRVARSVREAASDGEAESVVADEFDTLLGRVADEPTRRQLYRTVAGNLRAVDPTANRVTRQDLMGGLAAGWVVFACSIPAVLPFLFLDELHLALRISNAILLVLLFVVGYRTAQHTLARPWMAGAAVTLLGVGLVLLAIRLGG